MTSAHCDPENKRNDQKDQDGVVYEIRLIKARHERGAMEIRRALVDSFWPG
jgi:hypothetical protein